jgi:hypothetical protein
VLSPPDIKYRRRGEGEVIERVRFGKWRVQNWFYETPDINSWGMIYFGDRPNREIDNNLQSFQDQLPHVNFSILFFNRIFSILFLSFFDAVALSLILNHH